LVVILLIGCISIGSTERMGRQKRGVISGGSGGQGVFPVIPGIEFLGIGLDLNYLPPEAPKISLFQYSFNKGNQYQFQSEGTGVSYLNSTNMKYSVPDQVSVQTIASETSSSKLYMNYDQWNKDKQGGWGFSIDALIFSLSLHASTIDNRFQNSQSNLLQYTTAAQLYSISIDDAFLRNSFTSTGRAAMLAAADYPFSAIPDGYMTFIQKYGTHYIQGVTLGASIEVSSEYNNLQSGSEYGLNISVSISFGGFFIPISFDIDTEFRHYDSSRQYRTESITSLKVVGGLPDVGNFNSLMAASSPDQIARTRQMVQDWKQTMAINPGAINFNIKPMSNLFTSADASNSMNQAISCYYDNTCYSKYLKNAIKTYQPVAI